MPRSTLCATPGWCTSPASSAAGIVRDRTAPLVLWPAATLSRRPSRTAALIVPGSSGDHPRRHWGHYRGEATARRDPDVARLGRIPPVAHDWRLGGTSDPHGLYGDHSLDRPPAQLQAHRLPNRWTAARAAGASVPWLPRITVGCVADRALAGEAPRRALGFGDGGRPLANPFRSSRTWSTGLPPPRSSRGVGAPYAGLGAPAGRRAVPRPGAGRPADKANMATCSRSTRAAPLAAAARLVGPREMRAAGDVHGRCRRLRRGDRRLDPGPRHPPGRRVLRDATVPC